MPLEKPWRPVQTRPPGAGDAGTRVGAPDLVLRLQRKGAELQRIVGQDHMHPGLRAAATGEGLGHLAQHVVAEVEAAVARRLANAQEIARHQIGDSLVGTAAQALRLGRPLL